MEIERQALLTGLSFIYGDDVMREILSGIAFFNDELIEGDNLIEKDVYNGKSVYEVIRVIKGIPLFLELHLTRISNSGKLAGRDIWLTNEEITKRIRILINNDRVEDGNIKVVFTFNERQDKNFYAFFINHHYPSNNEYIKGVDTIFYHGERGIPNAKVINQSFRELVDEKIAEKRAFEAILVDRNGNITEGSKSNIFLVKGEKVYTSPKEDVLPGITREMICKLCEDNGITVIEKRVHFNDINNFDGLFISGTSPKVLPICTVEDNLFNSSNNDLIKKISKLYNDNIEKYISENEVI